MDSLDLQRVLSSAQGDVKKHGEVLLNLVERMEAAEFDTAFLYRASDHEVLAQWEAAVRGKEAGRAMPLLGVPFVVKDNIDVAGMPTTAACPAFSHIPWADAPVVARLKEAGAIVMAKTNMDQFATGLVGTRSPYGPARNTFNPEYISGGSSSGSAVAVAAGLASFSLGTDTAGSGRVPAALNNIVGLKPTKGMISTRGVIPACRSLDCVSIFALTCGDAAAVLKVAEGFDEEDPFSRKVGKRAVAASWKGLRVGVPALKWLEFYGDSEAAALYDKAVGRARSLGAEIVTIDYAPFLQTARLLYDGPWVAERLDATSSLLRDRPEELLPVLRAILEGATKYTAQTAFAAVQELARLSRIAEREWGKMDVLFLPTCPTVYKIEDSLKDAKCNSNMGYYTNFVNLLDLAGVAVPSGFLSNKVPQGVTLMGRAGTEAALLKLADVFQRSCTEKLGATKAELAATEAMGEIETTGVKVAVVGAHLSGEPLNWQLTQRGARLVETTRTAPEYKLFALPGTVPPKPGLVRVSEGGTGLEVEVWEMSSEAFGSFVAMIPAPLGIGTLRLESRQEVKGFLCEGYVTQNAEDISRYGGWRGYLRRKSS